MAAKKPTRKAASPSTRWKKKPSKKKPAKKYATSTVRKTRTVEREVPRHARAVRSGASKKRVPPVGTQYPATNAKAVKAGRLSFDSPNDQFVGAMQMLMPFEAEDHWRAGKLDQKGLDKLPPTKIVELLSDLSPDISRALWDFQRLHNPGYELKCFTTSYDPEKAESEAEIDKDATAICKEFIDRLKGYYGSFDVVLGRLSIAAFLRGAMLLELVIASDGETAVELATPDPATVRFMRKKDPQRGPYWCPGQWQLGKFVEFDRPTIKYVPIDPMFSDPKGRAPVMPALFATMFLIGMLHDLRRVVSQQGYPRHDISIDLEKLVLTMPPNILADPRKYTKWVDDTINSVVEEYKKLEPDHTFFHTSVVTVNRPVGAVESQSMAGFDALIRALERQAVRALKTMPLLMGINDTTTETHANRQWEIHVQGIKSIQHLAETILEDVFTLVCQARGVVAKIKFRFAELRASEELRDAQTETLKIRNAVSKREEGFVTQDEASMEVTGHKSVAPAPVKPVMGVGDIGNVPATETDDDKKVPAAAKEDGAGNKTQDVTEDDLLVFDLGQGLTLNLNPEKANGGVVHA